MARAANRFVCQSCGAVHGKWTGRCDSCGEWNSIVEEAAEATAPKGVTRAGSKPVAFTSLDGAPEGRARRTTGLKELDRVCGGGLVPGSALLVGGDPACRGQRLGRASPMACVTTKELVLCLSHRKTCRLV